MLGENKMDESLKQYFIQDKTGYYFDEEDKGYLGVAGVKRCYKRL